MVTGSWKPRRRVGLILAGAFIAACLLSAGCGDDADPGVPEASSPPLGPETPGEGERPGVVPTDQTPIRSTPGEPGAGTEAGSPGTEPLPIPGASSTSGSPPPATGRCSGITPRESGTNPPDISALVSGRYSVSSEDIAEIPVHDGYRYRARIFWPSDANGERPTQIFMPGFQLDGDDFYWYGEALASHGYVVLVPTVGDGLTNPRTHSNLGDDVVQLVGWLRTAAADSASPLFGHVAVDRIAAGGHSRGGKAAILAATRDERIRASFNMDPVNSNPPPPFTDRGLTVAPDRMGDFRIPGLFLGAGKGTEVTGGFGGFGGQACAPEGDNWESFFESAAGPVFGILVPNAGHNDFAAECRSGGGGGGFLPNVCSACPAGDHPEWNASLAIALSVAFHAWALEEDASCRSWLDGEAMDLLTPWVQTGTRGF